METKVEIAIRFEKKIQPLGELWLRSSSGQESASFQYSESWLDNQRAFALEPSLPLAPGWFHAGKDRKIFGFLADCLPDRWGRAIFLRMEKRRAEEAKETPKTLLEADFLLSANELIRQGAVIFSSDAKGGLPPIHFLGRLLSASTRLQKNMEEDEDIKMLLAPGASLGGARPKAAVLDNQGRLWTAKFPGVKDGWDVPLWEFLALQMARDSGLRVPDFTLQSLEGKNVFFTERFDRFGAERIPFASAMTLLDYRDGDQGSYEEIAEIIRRDGSNPSGDAREIWHRLIFNAMISNVDDHLRNHAFLREPEGWRLSPVFDLEVSPAPVKPQYQHTAIACGGRSTHLDDVFREALAVSEDFGLALNEAREKMQNMLKVGRNWLAYAREAKADKSDLAVMESAFRTKMPAEINKIHPARNAKKTSGRPSSYNKAKAPSALKKFFEFD